MIRRLVLSAVLAGSIVAGTAHSAVLPAAGAAWGFHWDTHCAPGSIDSLFSFRFAGRILHLGKTYTVTSGVAKGYEGGCTGPGSNTPPQFDLISTTPSGTVSDYCLADEFGPADYPLLHDFPAPGFLPTQMKIGATCRPSFFDGRYPFRFTATFYAEKPLPAKGLTEPGAYLAVGVCDPQGTCLYPPPSARGNAPSGTNRNER